MNDKGRRAKVGRAPKKGGRHKADVPSGRGSSATNATLTPLPSRGIGKFGSESVKRGHD
jgi:hypothetical protein